MRATWQSTPEKQRNSHDYIFWHRVGKVFQSLWVKQGRDSLYCNREANVKDAVMTVFEQVPPGSDCPYGRSVQLACKHLLPVLEKAFEMPGAAMQVGSSAWLNELKKNPQQITYLQAAKHEELEIILVRMLIQRGEKGTGFPRLRSGAPVVVHMHLCLCGARTHVSHIYVYLQVT